ncbi:MAG: CvpA family protein [Tannerellaceae bacterium]|nr:CvpA family protein [Tannerellaceae bacterium]
MNWLDILLLCLAGIGFMEGLFDGVIKQVVSLIALIVAIFFCGKVAVWLRDYIVALDWIPGEWVTLVSYVAAFLLIIGVVLLAGEIVHRVIGITSQFVEPPGRWLVRTGAGDSVHKPAVKCGGIDRP